MCLTVLMLDPDPKEGSYRLVLAFNRDEFYERPTRMSSFWEQNPNIISGQDMAVGKEGGTWLGMSREGKIAMLLNILQVNGINPEAKGRGSLVSDFLQGSLDGQSYLREVSKEKEQYNGFNLITIELGKPRGIDINYFTNSDQSKKEPERLEPGVHAFSNHMLNARWPKTDYVQSELEKVLARCDSLSQEELTEEILTLMSRQEPLHSCPSILQEDMDITKFRLILKELVFIKTKTYGTRSTTVILVDAAGNVSYTERSLKEPILPDRHDWLQQTHTFTIQ